MGSDWEDSDEAHKASATGVPHPVKPVKSKWGGEDEEESTPASDWDESSDEEEDEEEETKPAPAPPKKKGTIKAKLAEIEAAKAARARNGDDELDYDEDAVLDPHEKARRDKEREISADLENVASLLGAAQLGGSSSKELDALLSADPRNKEEFHALSAQIIELVIKRHQDKPLYPSFIEHHVRQLAEPLRDVEVRKAASGLTTLANEKQREQREKASGKKKPKSTVKPILGAAKVSSKIDTQIYDEVLDDFGKEADDFM
ncbi:translation initiation factor eIF3 subunit [Boletus edulis]|uniref:Eukaryotic translation initiation factor 3 subunit J n=1 Tax=Boletus edulis BED1 TaxID=1328754 RepID=A0AAD4GET7_BOLED|nr:translation initiation factor eIF3 subunit [Boletus edulis]KAF8440359.1 eukaryotic translation initiation factor 3 subunit J [Boletus edulis BED1]